MIERLQRALEHVEELPPTAQEEVAALIEELTEPLEVAPARRSEPDDEEHLPKSVRDALALGGAWSHLREDDEFAALDRIRHESPPSAPMDEQLAWLDDDEETS